MTTTSHSRLSPVIRYLAGQAWLSSLLIALVSYFMLHRYYLAVTSSDSASASIWVQTAWTGQYLIPAFFAIQTFVLLMRTKPGAKTRLPIATQLPTREALGKLSWRVFEHLCTSLYKSQGYQVSTAEENDTKGGVTLRLSKGASLYLAQSKHWKTRLIDIAEVNELSDAMANANATGGFIVSLGTFSPLAKTLARSRNIELTAVSDVFGMVGKRVQDTHQPSMTATPYVCPAYIAPATTETDSNATYVAGSCWQCGRFTTCSGTGDVTVETSKPMIVTAPSQS